MFLNDKSLIEWANNYGIRPFDENLVNPSSVDLRWSGRLKIATKNGWSKLYNFQQSTVLESNTLYLLDTLEYLTIPSDTCGILMLKSSIGRKGLEHLHAGFFDPGFHGTATLEIYNVAPWGIELEVNQPIVQIALARLNEIPFKDYTKTGRYNGQFEPTEART